jgi:hypothetical protein
MNQNKEFFDKVTLHILAAGLSKGIGPIGFVECEARGA